MQYPINEMFQTLQGEGFYTGVPAIFIRLQGCPVGCSWCDTKHTWEKLADRETALGDILVKTVETDAWGNADAALLMALKPNAILINACRGPVVDNAALLEVLKMRNDLSVVLDVWEPEPALSLDLLDRVDIGTAHIAGYTLEGKARGTTQVFEAWCDFLGQPQQVPLSELLPTPEFSSVTLNGPLDQATLKRLAHLVYDVRRDDAPLRKVAAKPGEFDRLRKTYQERREWSSLEVICNDAESASLLNALGFCARLNNS